MAGEFQKDIKFDEVQVGDLILVELFEGNHFYGDRRGTAKIRIGDIWYFDDMYPVYKEAGGYRMFKVTKLVVESLVPTTELERLRKIEAGLKEIVAKRTQSVETLKTDASILRAHGAFDASDSVLRVVDKIVAQTKPLEALLGE
jgi:hypothetical protein